MTTNESNDTTAQSGPANISRRQPAERVSPNAEGLLPDFFITPDLCLNSGNKR